MIPMARFQVGEYAVAIEASAIGNLLDSADLRDSHVVVDLVERWTVHQSPRARQFAEIDKSNVVLAMGSGVEFERWPRGRIAALPRWIAVHLPPELLPACGLGDNGDLVFIVDKNWVGEPKL